jgi:porphobilinogen synthase
MIHRPRRNRKSTAIRALVEETNLLPQHLVYPLFLTDGIGKKIEISSMPNVFKQSEDFALKTIAEAISLGINSFILFPVVPDNLKDKEATYSYASDCFYLKIITNIKKQFPEVCLISDVALDPYSTDGHDGYVENGEIINDKTLPILAKMAIAQAQAGIDIIGPSDMMDGRVGYLRTALDNAGYSQCGIMSYTSKYASAFYGPFRDALESAPKSGNKKTYQMNPANSTEALREAILDIEEGADFLMVKPAHTYLDIIQLLKKNSELPIVAYHVSGEYAMLKAADQHGWLDYKQCLAEVLISIRRAGANIIITYGALDYAKYINQK